MGGYETYVRFDINQEEYPTMQSVTAADAVLSVFKIISGPLGAE